LIKKLFFLIFFLAVCFSGFSQEAEAEAEILTQTQDNSIYVINSFNYNVKGLTRPFALNDKAQIEVGHEITGRANLEKFIQDKKQLLINERVLKDNVRIEYTVAEPLESGKYPVDMEIYVEDTWNIIALPYPKYDSNSGFELTIKARDYNFLGTMQPLRIDLGYRYDQDGESYFDLMLDSNYPFEALGLSWTFDFDHNISYRPTMEEPWYYKNTTGLSLDIPAGRTKLTTGFSVSFLVNEEITDSEKNIFSVNDEFQKGLYMSLKPYTSLEIPTGLEIGSFGELTYTPGISYTHNIEFSPWPLLDFKKGPFIDFSQNLFFGRIDWKGNLREGLSVNLVNTINCNFYYLRNDLDPLSYYYSVELKGYLIFLENFLGITSRLTHRHWINTSHDQAGDMLRGVYDRDVNAELMVSFNFDFQFLLLKIRPSEWFPSVKFMRIFNFDLQFNPVFDAAWYKSPVRDFSLNSENFLIGAGLELIIFPQSWRSLFFRISAAWDFSNISERTPIELFLGMELFY